VSSRTGTSVVVVGVDDTEGSRRALEWAAHEALRRGATLQVVTAWTWDAAEGAPLAAVDPTTLMDLAEQTQRDAVDQVLGPMQHRPVVAREVVRSTAADALVAASRQADLVVVGTHGRGPVRSALLGSVSQSVIKHAECPVVVMPPPHRTPARSDTVEIVERLGP
jgi:nucleotide-binding universal stress UspA family protein